MSIYHNQYRTNKILNKCKFININRIHKKKPLGTDIITDFDKVFKEKIIKRPTKTLADYSRERNTSQSLLQS